MPKCTFDRIKAGYSLEYAHNFYAAVSDIPVSTAVATQNSVELTAENIGEAESATQISEGLNVGQRKVLDEL